MSMEYIVMVRGQRQEPIQPPVQTYPSSCRCKSFVVSTSYSTAPTGIVQQLKETRVRSVVLSLVHSTNNPNKTLSLHLVSLTDKGKPPQTAHPHNLEQQKGPRMENPLYIDVLASNSYPSPSKVLVVHIRRKCRYLFGTPGGPQFPFTTPRRPYYHPPPRSPPPPLSSPAWSRPYRSSASTPKRCCPR